MGWYQETSENLSAACKRLTLSAARGKIRQRFKGAKQWRKHSSMTTPNRKQGKIYNIDATLVSEYQRFA